MVLVSVPNGPFESNVNSQDGKTIPAPINMHQKFESNVNSQDGKTRAFPVSGGFWFESNVNSQDGKTSFLPRPAPVPFESNVNSQDGKTNQDLADMVNRFESNVNSQDGKTVSDLFAEALVFESNVNSQDGKTLDLILAFHIGFESNVNSQDGKTSHRYVIVTIKQDRDKHLAYHNHNIFTLEEYYDQLQKIKDADKKLDTGVSSTGRVLNQTSFVNNISKNKEKSNTLNQQKAEVRKQYEGLDKWMKALNGDRTSQEVRESKCFPYSAYRIFRFTIVVSP